MIAFFWGIILPLVVTLTAIAWSVALRITPKVDLKQKTVEQPQLGAWHASAKFRQP